MILPRFLVRPCGLPVKKDDDHAISPAWSLERAVNAGRGMSACRRCCTRSGMHTEGPVALQFGEGVVKFRKVALKPL
jgi:hypothetical protein